MAKPQHHASTGTHLVSVGVQLYCTLSILHLALHHSRYVAVAQDSDERMQFVERRTDA